MAVVKCPATDRDSGPEPAQCYSQCRAPFSIFWLWVLWLPRWSAAPNWLPAPAGYSFLVVVLGPDSLASVRLNRLARLSQASAAVMSRRRWLIMFCLL
jgi:hypothetical protein